MSIRFAALPHTQDDADDRATSSSSDCEDYAEEDNNFEDWISDQGQLQACRSLFEDKTFTTGTEALTYDKVAHGFDLDTASKRLSAFFLARSLSIDATCTNRVRPSSSDTTDQLHSKTCKVDNAPVHVKNDRVVLA